MASHDIKGSKVMMVGAGGIGCELLKTLALSGFRDIHILSESHRTTMTTMTVNCQGLSTGLEQILESDDVARLVNLLRDQPTDLKIINSLVEKCVESGASNCLIALIRGEVCNIHPTFNAGKLPDSGVTALAYVAHSCPDPEVINLMLTKCGGACLANFGCTIGLVHGLPIHFVLINLSIMEHLYFWYRGSSIIKLISLLCLWETKPIMDSLRVLVKYTDSINEIAWTILKNGGFKHFAALLLIAHEKVMAPFDTGFTIKHYINTELDSIPEGSELDTEQEEYKCILTDARTLLALFEVTGDELSSYCSSIQKAIPVEDMMNDISSVLIKNQVNVSENEIDFSFRCEEYHKYSYSAYWKLVESNDCNKVTGDPFKHSLLLCRNFRPHKKTFMPMQLRYYTTGACQARKMSKSFPRTSVCPLPWHFGSSTLRFINRVRFL